MLTPQDVRTAYQLILGREPESQTMVDNFVAHASFDALRRALLGSSEFAERFKADARMLGVSPVMFIMSEDVRLCSRRQEHLASLDLAFWGRSVLLSGLTACATASFFADRQCAVSIAAPADTLAVFDVAVKGLQSAKAAANLAMITVDLTGAVDETEIGRHQIVYADLPDTDELGLFSWFDNVSRACTDVMILNAAVAPGRAEETFLRQGNIGAAAGEPEVCVPTRTWLMARLKERFAFVYATTTQPNHETYPLDWTRGWMSRFPAQQAVFIGSRTALESPFLADQLPNRQSRFREADHRTG